MEIGNTTSGGPVLEGDNGRNEKAELVEFIRSQISKTEKELRFRTDSETQWAGGTDASWRAIGCKLNKAQRLKESAMHGRIAEKVRVDLRKFQAVLSILETEAS